MYDCFKSKMLRNFECNLDYRIEEVRVIIFKLLEL